MLIDLILAIAHHLAVFSLAAILAAELALIRPGVSRGQAVLVSRIDASYGALAGVAIVVGFLRVFFGIKGSAFYLSNPVFWAKIGAFLLVGILSIQPTLRFIAWRRRMRTDEAFAPEASEVSAIRRLLFAEAGVFAFIPVFAAAMARGYGL